MPKLLGLAAATILTAGGLGALPPSASAGDACHVTWGSTREQAAAFTTPTIVNLRAGRHECFDRLVVDFGEVDPRARGRFGYSVRYVREVTEDASGEPVPLRGGAFLEVFINATAFDDNGDPTYDPPRPRNAVRVRGFSTLRQVAFLGTFEGLTQVGVGVRARLPFRVFALPGPGAGARLVIDVAHHW